MNYEWDETKRRAIIGMAKDVYPPDYLERERESW